MRVVSFFAGCGGLDLGFEQAGFQVVWANEFDTTVRDTYLKNHPNTKFVLADINAISSEAIPDCDGFIGGPPCQSWSVAGKREVHFSNRLGLSVLVGYYKNEEQYNYVLKNRLYYVRSDGRKGSIFKQDCAMTPRYLLLYHGDKAEIYELDAEEPVLASGAFLRTLGFDSAGEMYLCFNLKDSKGCTIEELGGNMGHPNYDKNNYAPYFTTLEKIRCKTN